MLYKSLMTLGLALLATSGQAQEKGWYVVSATEHGVSVMDMGSVERKGQRVIAQSAMYLAQQTKTPEGVNVDVLQTLEEFDCSQPGKMRNIRSAGYRIDKQAPVFSFAPNEKDPSWREFGAQTPGMAVWKAACEGPDPTQRIEGTSDHREILQRVRQAAVQRAE